MATYRRSVVQMSSCSIGRASHRLGNGRYRHDVAEFRQELFHRPRCSDLILAQRLRQQHSVHLGLQHLFQYAPASLAGLSSGCNNPCTISGSTLT